jgi:hypothetical protein
MKQGKRREDKTQTYILKKNMTKSSVYILQLK